MKTIYGITRGAYSDYHIHVLVGGTKKSSAARVRPFVGSHE